ncbi:MAG: NAD(P)(+) transhydrogenase (Re/Si-specific) subunit beta [Acidobacteria bacterium]|nr:NAD(P)(+) transhydrogenase (Re/Si-specific) subunit beta [Acidobacteriota bacterium]
MSITFINLVYILAALLFALGIKMLSSPDTARKGNFISALGMLIAIIVTLLYSGLDYKWIIVGGVAGAIIGTLAAKLVKMTQMPEMVALFNGFGGIASLLVGWSEFHMYVQPTSAAPSTVSLITIFLAVLIGGITFSGSLVAWGKLAEILNSKPWLFPGQKIINALLFAGILAAGALLVINPVGNYPVFIGIVVVSIILGVLSVVPIGGADMPVVIALLNSYSGLAACAAGFVIDNNLLIVAGALVGASGIILTNIMCKAMNRSLANVLFSGFGATTRSSKKVEGEVKPISVDDAYLILEAAGSVVIVPGYGMAVAQAQHVVRELGELLEANGTEVSYAVHPVAGRMPGHMNVLLAEANVPYEQLVEPQDVNPKMELIDVAIVIGANDVVNPDARDDNNSPLYGMPIIEVDRAKTTFVLKRSMAAGFAGVDNPLFFGTNTRMLFGDAKASITGLVSEFKG